MEDWSREVELKVEIERAMRSLTSLEAAIIRLQMWEGLSTRDIADRLAISVNRVREERRGALSKLQQLLQEP